MPRTRRTRAMRARDVLVLSVLCAQAAWVCAQEEQEQAIEVKAGTSVELDGEAMMEAIRARQKNRQNTENEPASPDAHVETTVRETTVIRETTTDDDAKVDESSTIETSQTSHELDSTGPASASETVVEADKVADAASDQGSDVSEVQSANSEDVAAEEQPPTQSQEDAPASADADARNTAEGTGSEDPAPAADGQSSETQPGEPALQTQVLTRGADADQSESSEHSKQTLDPRIQQVLDDVKARLDIASPLDHELHRRLDDAIGTGSDQAMAYKGTALLHGDGVKPDVAETTKLFKQAAEMGNAHAQREMAFLYANGFIGTEPDEVPYNHSCHPFSCAPILGKVDELSHSCRRQLSSTCISLRWAAI